MKPRFFFLVVLFQILHGAVTVQAAQQTVTLGTNWNLLSLWVQPTNPAVSAVFTNLIQQGRLISVFTYEYGGTTNQGAWKRFYPGLTPDKTWLNTLSELRACQGYWVNMSPGPSATLTVSGSVTAAHTNGLRAGWNLIGLGNDRRVFWADAFGSMAGGLQALFTLDPQTNLFIGFNQPQFRQADLNGNGVLEIGEFEWGYTNEAGVLRYVEPGQALWVKVPANMDVAPMLEVEVESDVDACAAGASTNIWFQPGIDTDINGNGVLDYGFSMPGKHDPYGNEYRNTQETIWFRVPTGGAHSNLMILRQDITVLNNGPGGVLQFEIDATNAPWLSISPTNGSVLQGPSGQVVTLRADLAGLPVGETNTTLRIRSNGGDRSYLVKLTVPDLDGLYSGQITITNLQGRASVSLTSQVQVQLNLRGTSILLAQGSSTFPTDIGLLNSGTPTQFDISGTTSLNAGQIGNPFNYPVQRTARFRGARIVAPAGQTFGMNLGLMGDYQETLQGGPNGPVLLLGYFTLNAKTDKTVLQEP